MYHWETSLIEGTFEQIQGKWWAWVNCTRYGVQPDMLEGRVITIKGQRKRLGKMAANTRPERAYYRVWEVRDYSPCEAIEKRLAGLWLISDPATRNKEIFALRVMIKDDAVRIRAGRPYDATAPSLEGWTRWALECLDDRLLSQAATGWPLPANQLTRVGEVDMAEAFKMFSWRPQPHGRAL